MPLYNCKTRLYYITKKYYQQQTQMIILKIIRQKQTYHAGIKCKGHEDAITKVANCIIPTNTVCLGSL